MSVEWNLKKKIRPYIKWARKYDKARYERREFIKYVFTDGLNAARKEKIRCHDRGQDILKEI